MGFKYRKSFKPAPGVRMTVSKSGIGYSVGGNGARITKRARGGLQTTVHVPGTGLSYTTNGGSASGRARSTPHQAGSVVQSQGGAAGEGRELGIEPTPSDAFRKARVPGFWYYVVVVATAGTFAWVPFLHAATRLKTAHARRLALIFGGLDALMYVLLAITPHSSQGQTVDGPISTTGGLLALGIIIVGCILVTPLRRMVYEAMPADGLSQSATTDPAIRAALDARARRDAARKLAADDPLLARELRIGRPDLTRSYDDGGLVDLNSAPAQVIAAACGISLDVAATIVDVRNGRGEPFTNVDELFVVGDIPVTAWDRIRDRAVLIP